MINIENLSYRIILTTEDSQQYDITDPCTDLSWEENEKEIATKINIDLHNIKHKGKYLSDYCKLNTLIDIYAGWGNIEHIVATGKIVDWEISEESDVDDFRLVCYDDSYDLQQSDYSYYIKEGTSCKAAIQKICKDWGIDLEYWGPETKLAKNPIKAKKVAEIIFDLLKEARQKGGGKVLVRGERKKINVIRYGMNKTVYYLSGDDNITSVSYKISTASMVTRIQITGKEENEKQAPVEATLDGKIEYGIRQKIVSRGSDDSLDKAKKDAQTILDEDGKPEETIKIKCFDVPTMRKGDKVFIKTNLLDGYYYVLSITHDASKLMMYLEVEKVN